MICYKKPIMISRNWQILFPDKIGSVDLAMNLSNSWSTKQVAKSQFLEILEMTNQTNKNSPMINENDVNKSLSPYTDGTCSNNGKPSASSGIGISFGYVFR
jgi:hypothetical protein